MDPQWGWSRDSASKGRFRPLERVEVPPSSLRTSGMSVHSLMSLRVSVNRSTFDVSSGRRVREGTSGTCGDPWPRTPREITVYTHSRWGFYVVSGPFAPRTSTFLNGFQCVLAVLALNGPDLGSEAVKATRIDMSLTSTASNPFGQAYALGRSRWAIPAVSLSIRDPFGVCVSSVPGTGT